MTMKNPWTGNFFFFLPSLYKLLFFSPLEIGDWRTVARSINIRRLIIFTVVNGWITLEEGFP